MAFIGMGLGAAASRGKLLATTAYSGTGAAQDIVTGQNTSNGALAWAKATSGVTGNNGVVDTERGVNKILFTDNTNTESTATSITAFNSNGITVEGTDNDFNNSSGEYILFTWLKRAGYLDIHLDTGTGVIKAENHDLDAPVAMMIRKSLSVSGAWAVYHKDMDGGGQPEKYLMELQGVAGRQTEGVNGWNATAPTSTQFTVGSGARVNTSGATYVTYLFADKTGSSKSGFYDGNASSSNPVTGLGFTPSAILIMDSTDSDDRYLYYNDGGTIYNIKPNTTGAREGASSQITFDSDGFTITSAGTLNTAIHRYIYMAWG